VNYYKKLEIDVGDIPAKLQKYIEDRPELIKGTFSFLRKSEVYKEIPELEHLFKPLDLTIEFLAIVYYKFTHDTIHVDNDTKQVRINFPIANCEGTFTKWWKVTEPPEKRFTAVGGIPYDYYDPDKCQLMDQLELDGVYAIRVLEPHSVSALSEEKPRITVSIGFVEDIEYLLD
jgi:hypothetical protein